MTAGVAALVAPTAALADSPPEPVGISNVVGTPIPPDALAENTPELVAQFHVEIHNVEGGAIERVSLDGERTHLGSVQRPASSTVEANDGFWASKYSRAVDGTTGHLLATSVYVLRSKVGPDESYDPTYYDGFDPATDERDWTTRLLNMRPDHYIGADHGKWLADTIYTDIPGGSGIFGGESSLPTGSPLTFFDEEAQEWRPIEEHFIDDPSIAPPERVRFTAHKPLVDGSAPDYLEFENWAAGDTVAGEDKEENGAIVVGYPDGTRRHIADVVQRVEGIGRFGGTEFAHVGQMDTNHPGALTFSTSPYVGFTWDTNQMGGFQIVPANHVKFLSNDLGQNSFMGRPQWLIVGPRGADPGLLLDERYIIDDKLSFTPGWEAVAPIFGMYARATFDPDDLENSTYFEVSYDFGQSWEPAPEFVGVAEPSTCEASTCPHNWTNIRVNLTYPGGEPESPSEPDTPVPPGAPSPPVSPNESDYGFFLHNGWTGAADHTFHYGRGSDQVLIGDWDGDGTDTIIVRRGSDYFVSNALRPGTADHVFTYGRPDDVVLVGDWDGDGTDTLAVRRGAAYHVKNSLSSGVADQVVVYGRPGDDVVVGDWDGNGTDTLTVRRGAHYFVKNTLAGGQADTVVVYGRADDEVLVGDWDGNGRDTFAVRRGAQYFVSETLRSGPADLVVVYGRVGDEALVGDWDGDGADGLGVRRTSTI